MEWMVFDDMTNIALLCLLMGFGVIAFCVIAFLYLAALAIMEDSHD